MPKFTWESCMRKLLLCCSVRSASSGTIRFTRPGRKESCQIQQVQHAASLSGFSHLTREDATQSATSYC